MTKATASGRAVDVSGPGTILPPASERDLAAARRATSEIDLRQSHRNAVEQLRDALHDLRKARARSERLVAASKHVEEQLTSDPCADAAQHEWARILRAAREGAE